MAWCQILESDLKDLNIIDRRLHNMILNGSVLKRFRFLDEFSSLTLQFTWPFIIVVWCAPRSNKLSRAMRNEIGYIPVRKHWNERRLQLRKQKSFTTLNSLVSFWSSSKVIEVGSKFRRNYHLRCKHQIVYIPRRKHLRERWFQWVNWEAY